MTQHATAEFEHLNFVRRAAWRVLHTMAADVEMHSEQLATDLAIFYP